MILPGSYANGFAPRDGRPLYPELWRGCAAAWAPCLGPTGLTLRDWSGFGRHGTLANLTAANWVTTDGRYAVRGRQASNSQIDISSLSISGGNYTFMFWLKLRSFTSGFPFVMSGGTTLELGSSASGMFFRPGVEFSGGSQFVVGRLEHRAVVASGGTVTLYINGRPFSSASHTYGTISGFRLLNGSDALSNNIYSMDGDLFETSIHATALSQKTIALAASRIGIAYELAPRRRSRIFTGGFKAYWAARKAQIIGGGL
jgi:hypothetical protein